MTSKNTKRALLMSCISLLLCMSMLVGTTFAWFTDSASTGVNTIVSGNLDVTLEMLENGEWVNAEGKTLNFVKAEGAEAEEILWEPGCTYNLPAIRIVNQGNLALKYEVVITGIEGDAKLNEAIEWSFSGIYKGALAPGQSSEGIVISGHMKEEAGNEYQDLTIDGISITVMATQDTYENDSYDNQYDALAGYYTVDEDAKTVLIENLGGLIAFRNAVNGGNNFKGYTVNLNADIDMMNMVWEPIGNVKDYPSITFAGVFDGNGHTISNMYAVDTTANWASAGLFGSITGEVKNLTIDNATVISTHYAGGIVGYQSEENARITNCTVKNSTITSNVELKADGTYDNGDKVGGIIGYMVASCTVDGCTVENTTINAYRDLGGIVGYSAGTVTNNTVKDVTLVIDKNADHNYKNYTEDFQHDLGQVVGENSGTESNNTVENVTEIKKVVAMTSAELVDFLNHAGEAHSGNTIVELTSDIVLTDAWTPVVIDGYNGAGVVTVEGNGHTISGLTAPLFAGGFAGNSGIVINNLTIADSTIVSTNTIGSGAFIECIDSMPTITLNNCHLLNSSVSGSRTGGLIGWTAGYDNENDGPVQTYVTITNCSVIGCTINGGSESVGAINGHAGNNAWTYTTIENCVVKNNTLVGGEGKTGVILGTANVGEVTITGCTMENNTVNGAASETVYGRFVPNQTGKLTVDGTAVN